MITFEPYKAEDHKHLLELVLTMRDMPASYADDVPALGYVAHFNDTPAAFAFIRRIEGDHLALFDGLITNPQLSPRVRNDAVDNMTLMIIEAARSLGIKRLAAYSLDENTLSRARRHGFQSLPHTLIVKEL